MARFARDDETVVVFRSRPVAQRRLRLFCLPCAGGSAASYRPLADALPPTVEVNAVQPPRGRGRPDCDALVDDLAEALLPWADEPFALLGHSMGGLLSFEVARRMRRNYAIEPLAVLVAACRAPQLPVPRYGARELDSDAFWQLIAQLDGTPREVLESPRMREAFEPALRGDLGLCESYEFREDEPLDCDLVAYAGMSDTAVPAETMEPWAEHTAGRFTLQRLPGAHFFLDTHREAFAEQLTNDLHALPVLRSVRKAVTAVAL